MVGGWSPSQGLGTARKTLYLEPQNHYLDVTLSNHTSVTVTIPGPLDLCAEQDVCLCVLL